MASASASPSVSPSVSPSGSPSSSPSVSPSGSPSVSASRSPSASPSISPSGSPSLSPSASASPSVSPSVSPSKSPSVSPSASPSEQALEVVNSTSDNGIRGVQVIKWGGLGIGGNNIGKGVSCPNFPNKSVQVVGTFAGATVTLQGSNIPDDPEYATLNDAEGDALSFSSAGLKQMLENPYWVRPVVTSLGATTDLDVYLLVQTSK